METSLVGFLLIGLAAGWLAGMILRDRGMGLLKNLVVGVIGAYVGGYLSNALGIRAGGLVGDLVMATIGAVVLLFVIVSAIERIALRHHPRAGGRSQ